MIQSSTQSNTQSEHILVVDDDPDIRELLASYLELHAYKVSRASGGEEMFNVLDKEACHLVVLDIMMPGEDGLALCRRLRQGSQIPVIFLTALGETTERVVGLELGADDYLTKPFEPRELLARIRAVLRRAFGEVEIEEVSHPHLYKFENWTLDCGARHLLNPEGVVVNLSGAEYRLLLFFLMNAQQVLTREQLVEAVQGKSEVFDRSPFDRSIDVQISRLRSRLQDNGREAKLIKTVRGDGYVFATNVQAITK